MAVNGYNYKVKTARERLRTKPFYHYENGDFSAFDIPAIISKLKAEESWEKGELSSVILLQSPSIKVLLTLLHGGTEVISYQANDSITFQVLEGSLVLHIRNESIMLYKGEVLTLDEKIKYSFDSVEETAILLTLVSEKEE
jgi:mannose-6-phosphate isomerase-like protein (cupin superfamily)